MNFATFVTTAAEAQFISVIDTLPHLAWASVVENARAVAAIATAKAILRSAFLWVIKLSFLVSLCFSLRKKADIRVSRRCPNMGSMFSTSALRVGQGGIDTRAR